MNPEDTAAYAFMAETQRNEELRRQEQLRTIEFGQQVQKFLDSRIGQRILSDAEDELKDLTNELLELNVDEVEGRNRIRQILARAAVLQHWQQCFGRYIIDGRNSEKEMAGDEAIE